MMGPRYPRTFYIEADLLFLLCSEENPRHSKNTAGVLEREQVVALVVLLDVSWLSAADVSCMTPRESDYPHKAILLCQTKYSLWLKSFRGRNYLDVSVSHCCFLLLFIVPPNVLSRPECYSLYRTATASFLEGRAKSGSTSELKNFFTTGQVTRGVRGVD